MIMNPFLDRLSLWVDVPESDEVMNNLEDYLSSNGYYDLCEDKSGFYPKTIRIFGKFNEMRKRLEQFCKVKSIYMQDDLVDSDYTIHFLKGFAQEESPCQVVGSHCFIDRRGDLWPCMSLREAGIPPMFNISKWIHLNKELDIYRNKIEELRKEGKVEEAQEASTYIQSLVSDHLKANNEYSKENIGWDKEACSTYCFGNYKKYNDFISLITEMNRKFRV